MKRSGLAGDAIGKWNEAIELFSSEKYQESLTILKQLASERGEAKIMFDVAVVTRKMGNQAGALAALKQTTEIDNHLAVAWFLMGIVCCEDKRTMAEAPLHFQRAADEIKLRKEISYAQVGLRYRLHKGACQYNAAWAYWNSKQPGPAREWIAKAVETIQGETGFKEAEKVAQLNEAITKNRHKKIPFIDMDCGLVFAPPRSKVKNVGVRNYEGKAKLLGKSKEAEDDSTVFEGEAQMKRKGGRVRVNFTHVAIQVMPKYADSITIGDKFSDVKKTGRVVTCMNIDTEKTVEISEADFTAMMKEYEHMKKNNLYGIAKPKGMEEEKKIKFPLIGKKSEPKKLEIIRTDLPGGAAPAPSVSAPPAAAPAPSAAPKQPVALPAGGGASGRAAPPTRPVGGRGVSGRGSLPPVPTQRPNQAAGAATGSNEYEVEYDDIDEFEARFMAEQPEYANSAVSDDIYANTDLNDAPDSAPAPVIPPRPKPRFGMRK